MKSPSGLPLTDSEKGAALAQTRKADDSRIARIKACPSGQNYARKPTEADKALWARKIGELDDIAKAS